MLLRWLREACGLTQDRWAALVGVSRKTVQRWESGYRTRLTAHMRPPVEWEAWPWTAEPR